jgi:hypothetical protein
MHPGSIDPIDAKSVRFPRQLDQDGLYHSVCMTCFRTIAISSNPAVLAEKEWLHSCDGRSPQVLSGPIPTTAQTELLPR